MHDSSNSSSRRKPLYVSIETTLTTTELVLFADITEVTMVGLMHGADYIWPLRHRVRDSDSGGYGEPHLGSTDAVRLAMESWAQHVTTPMHL
jgi:hypothetical protein